MNKLMQYETAKAEIARTAKTPEEYEQRIKETGEEVENMKVKLEYDPSDAVEVYKARKILLVEASQCMLTEARDKIRQIMKYEETTDKEYQRLEELREILYEVDTELE